MGKVGYLIKRIAKMDKKAMLRKTSESAYVRQIEIVYVFDGEQSITDFDI